MRAIATGFFYEPQHFLTFTPQPLDLGLLGFDTISRPLDFVDQKLCRTAVINGQVA